MGRPIGGAVGLLGLWMATLLLPCPADSCGLETAWSHGRLGPDALLAGYTLNGTGSGSCRCCALCHHVSNCTSLSFNSHTAECELYSTVASYVTLQPDLKEQWTYFVMPGRSEHEQFCREDTDCLAEGDACRGRVCTNHTAVTCRVICEELGAGTRYGGDFSRVYGWLAGQPLIMTCRMESPSQGFTQILSSTRGFQFDSDTVLSYNIQLNPDTVQYSILRLAEDLRLSKDDTANYTIQIWWWACPMNSWDVLTYQQPRDELVLAEAPRDVVGSGEEWKLCHPWNATKLYRPPSAPTLISINADGAEEDDVENWGALAREDGNITNEWITVYIRE